MSSIIAPGGKTAKVKQACDCCHIRKIRCDGSMPCANCKATELQCTYLAVPKKKGPKGRRIPKANAGSGKTALPFQRSPPPGSQQNVGIGSPLPAGSTYVLPSELPSQLPLPEFQLPMSGSRIEPEGFRGSSPISPRISEASHASQRIGFQRSPLVSDALVKACVDAFFRHKYPIMPILDKKETYGLLPYLDESPENCSLIISLCALIVLQPEIIDSSYVNSGAQIPTAEFLINEAIRARHFCNHMEENSLAHVQTSFFFFAALFPLGKDNSAWFYIREAMTMLQLQRLHEESTYLNMQNPLCKIYCRRTFWLLFITERAYALQRHRPLTLQRTLELPTVDPGPEAVILSGFLDLVLLFQNFDDKFLTVWNFADSDNSEPPQSLAHLQANLNSAVRNVAERTDIQQADLLVSKQWLKTMVWQLSVRKGLLSSASADESMTFHYPINIAREMVGISRLLPTKAFEANGVGILEKIFDIGCSLSDVLQVHPSFGNVSGVEIGPREYLVELIRILHAAPGGNKYLRLLTEKADDYLHAGITRPLSDSDSPVRLEEIIDDEEEEMNPMNYRRFQDGVEVSPPYPR